MHSESIAHLQCQRDFADVPGARERGARWVVGLTAAMMVAELVIGYWTRSLALTADGWHMATHAAALALTALAYWFARSRAGHHAFCFGTGKIHALAGYSSALILMLVALSMVGQSALRFFRPALVHYAEALPVAVLGLLVNLACVRLLGHSHDPDDHHDHHLDHPPPHDYNQRAALMHVIADAFTSVLAIVSLVLGAVLDWRFPDPLIGLLGGLVVLKWGLGLCRSAGRQLVDATSCPTTESRVRALLEGMDDARVADLHSWEIGPGRRACIVSLISGAPRDIDDYRRRVLTDCPLAHLTIEVHRCSQGHSGPQPMISAVGVRG
jgi:cation diffusion facilitator family transporter